jgi:hypothetical protein
MRRELPARKEKTIISRTFIWWSILNSVMTMKKKKPIKVTAITTRRNPIYLAMTTGFSPSESKCLGKWGLSASIHRLITRLVVYPENMEENLKRRSPISQFPL